MIDLQQVKTIANRKNILLKDIAENIGMSYQNLNRCLKENKIMVNDLENIANFLEVPIGIFLGINENLLNQGTPVAQRIADLEALVAAQKEIIDLLKKEK